MNIERLSVLDEAHVVVAKRMRFNRPPIVQWIALAIFVTAVLLLSRLMLSL